MSVERSRTFYHMYLHQKLIYFNLRIFQHLCKVGAESVQFFLRFNCSIIVRLGRAGSNVFTDLSFLGPKTLRKLEITIELENLFFLPINRAIFDYA